MGYKLGDPERERVIDRIFAEGTGKDYDAIVDYTTNGMDTEWKEQLLSRISPKRRVLDLACGTGILSSDIRSRFPEVELVGVDMTADYLAVAQSRLATDSKASFILSPAEEAPLHGQFDLVITSYLPKYADLGILIPRLTEHLDSGGQMIMHDFTRSENPAVGRILKRRFRKLGEWAEENYPKAVGMFDTLPDVIEESNWVEELTAELEKANYRDIEFVSLSHGQAGIVSAIRS